MHFQKGQNKEAVARPYLEAAAREGKDRVVRMGIAQERASVWRSWPQKGQGKAAQAWGIPSGGPRSGRPTPMHPCRSGCGSTATSGPSGSWRKLGSAMRPWITDSVAVPTRPRAKDVRSTRTGGGAELLRAMGEAVAQPVHRGRPASGLRLRTGLSAVRGLRRLCVRSTARGSPVVRGGDSGSPRRGPTAADRPCGRLANPPTGVCVTPRPQTRSRPLTRPPFVR